tara:strand:+ start:1520 stop:2068 length:549 start_codon:yes stop_codon:yes gene_type:complete
MESINILIIGDCGVGKTYTMQQLIKNFNCKTKERIGLINYNTNGFMNVTGRYDGSTFQGSDKLSMSVMTTLNDFLSQTNGVNIYEGDRFMNKNFIAAAKPYIIKINGNGIKGRSLRGSNQTQRQIKSIQTRVSNIKYDFSFADSPAIVTYLKNLLKTDNKKLITKVLQSDKENYEHQQKTLF